MRSPPDLALGTRKTTTSSPPRVYLQCIPSMIPRADFSLICLGLGGCLCTAATTRLLTLVPPPDEAQLQKQFGSLSLSLLGRLGGDTSNKARAPSKSKLVSGIVDTSKSSPSAKANYQMGPESSHCGKRRKRNRLRLCGIKTTTHWQICISNLERAASAPAHKTTRDQPLCIRPNKVIA